MIFELCLIIIFELYILMLAVLFEVFPGNNYKIHKHEIQFWDSVIMLLVATIVLVVSKIFPKLLSEQNILMQTDIILPFWGFFVIIFICSIYKYQDMKKHSEDIYFFELKKVDYQLLYQFDLTLGSCNNLPNVKCIADCGKYIIVFSSVRPSSEEDAVFICKKIKENIFECISITENTHEFNVKKIIAAIGTWTLLLLSMIDAVLLILIGHRFTRPEINSAITKYAGYFGLMVFGLLCIKLFKNVGGVAKYFFVTFGAVIILLCLIRIILGA